MERFFQKIKLIKKFKIFKILVIFSLTGMSSLFISDLLIVQINKKFNEIINIYYEIFLIIIIYHFLLVFFCYIFGEIRYVQTKLRRFRQLLKRLFSG